MRAGAGRRRGFSLLETLVAFAVFGFALAGLYPLMLMQSKQLTRLEKRFADKTTYYLTPSTDEWTRKLGASAALGTVAPGPAPTPPVTLVDNFDAGYSEAGTGWGAEVKQTAFGGDQRWHTAGTGANTAAWTFTGLQAGWYDVQATWVAQKTNATNTPYTVYDGSRALGTVAVNQQIAPLGPVFQGVTWQSLGTFSLRGSTLAVQLSDKANDRVVADAVRVVAVRNVVQVTSLERSLTGQKVTVHVSVTVVTPQ